jgi:hypothetical protein
MPYSDKRAGAKARPQGGAQAAAGRPFTCKAVIYHSSMGSGGDKLVTFFQQMRQGWLLVGWTLF